MSKYDYFETVYIKDWWAVLPVDLLISLEHVYLNSGIRREQLSYEFDDLVKNVQLSRGDWSKYSILRREGIGLPRCGEDVISALEVLGLICDTGGRISIGRVGTVKETFPVLPVDTVEQIEKHHSLLENGVKIKEMMDSGTWDTREEQVQQYANAVVCDKDKNSLMWFLDNYVEYLLKYQQAKGGAS